MTQQPDYRYVHWRTLKNQVFWLCVSIFLIGFMLGTMIGRAIK